MKTKCIIAIAFSLTFLVGCNGQSKNEKNNSDNKNKPQSSIKVNKEYDKDGNLIRYDSTYSYYYSNVQKNEALKDSIFNNFKSDFNEKYFFSDEPYFNNFFFQDSLLKYDFYKNDFFLKRFKDNMERMDSLFKGMDMFKNDFFEKQFHEPGILKAPKN
jgi:hypothetical protein